MLYPIYTGDEAHRKLDYLLQELGAGKFQYPLRLPEDRCCGYFFDKTCWIAFDNRTNECWTEELRSKKRCRQYLNIKKSEIRQGYV